MVISIGFKCISWNLEHKYLYSKYYKSWKATFKKDLLSAKLWESIQPISGTGSWKDYSLPKQFVLVFIPGMENGLDGQRVILALTLSMFATCRTKLLRAGSSCHSHSSHVQSLCWTASSVAFPPLWTARLLHVSSPIVVLLWLLVPQELR